MKKKLIAAVMMLLWIFIMSIDDISYGATYYGNTGYERRIRLACENATMTRTRTRTIINTPEAKRCFYRSIQNHREEKLVDSQINLNNAIIKRLGRVQRW